GGNVPAPAPVNRAARRLPLRARFAPPPCSGRQDRPLSARPAGTEAVDPRYAGLDTWSDDAILGALLEGQQRALRSVAPAIPALGAAAGLAAHRLAAGGRLIYLAAGSPALIALGDALEIPQTYGVPRDRIVLLFAGGHAIAHEVTGADED